MQGCCAAVRTCVNGNIGVKSRNVNSRAVVEWHHGVSKKTGGNNDPFLDSQTAPNNRRDCHTRSPPPWHWGTRLAPKRGMCLRAPMPRPPGRFPRIFRYGRELAWRQKLTDMFAPRWAQSGRWQRGSWTGTARTIVGNLCSSMGAGRVLTASRSVQVENSVRRAALNLRLDLLRPRSCGSKPWCSGGRLSSFKGLANFSQLDRNSRRDVHVDASAVSVMFATYVDLPELGVPGIGALSPFVGGRSRAFPHQDQ